MTLDDLLARPYRVEVNRKGGGWVAAMPDLCLVAEGSDRAAALARLDEAANALFTAHLSAGTVAKLPRPRAAAADPAARIWVKAGAVALVLVSLVLALEAVAARTLERLPERGLRYVFQAIDNSTARARQVSDERQRELAHGLSGFLTAVRPFLDEVGKSLPERTCPPPAQRQ